MSSFDATLRLATPPNAMDHRLGASGASMVVVQFGAYDSRLSCEVAQWIQEIPRWFRPQASYVYRHGPCASEIGFIAAQAVEAAAADGKFFEMHNALCARDGRLTRDAIDDCARFVNLNSASIAAAVASKRHESDVRCDIECAELSGLKSVPALFVNGSGYVGPMDLESLIDSIEELLPEV